MKKKMPKNEIFENIEKGMMEVIDMLDNDQETNVSILSTNSSGLIINRDKKKMKPSDMIKQNKNRIKELEKTIATLDTFFEKGDDCVSPLTREIVLDNEYDLLKKELFLLFPKSKIFITVTASKIKDGEKKVIHDPPMTSINKCNGTEIEKLQILYKWIKDAQKNIPIQEIPKNFDDHLKKNFSMSFKHDGLALSLEYENGILIKAGLRSKSGMDGINVTDKTQYIKGIPQQLPLPITCKIRGEVETDIPEFERVSEQLGDNAKMNPRAHTAGSMNQKTADKMKDRGLRFVAYNILSLEHPPYTTEIERAKWATRVLKLNFVKTIPFKIETLRLFEDQHRKLDFMVDGVVISVNNLQYQEELGNSGNKDTGNPKGKLAWKFKDEVKTTIVQDIVWQTGRTGNVTPVLVINPIQLEGTTVSKCTAHNIGIIRNNNIGIGSKVEIIKSGKIIPKLHKVVEPKGKINSPKCCPSCNSDLIEKKGANGALTLICNNADCPAQGTKNLNHYLKILGAKGIAESTINKLVDTGLVQKRSDFYKLTLNNLLNNGFPERTSILILARIWMISSPEQEKNNNILKEKLKKITIITIPIDKFIASFGMDGAGKEVGRLLSKKYGDFDKIRNLQYNDLEAIDGIGSVIAKSVHDFFSINKNEVNQLLQFINFEIITKKSGPLKDKSFVLSGALDMGKNYWKKQIEDNGGEVKSSVGKKINYVVAGPGSGAKSDKAEELGIPIIDEEDLEKMLN